MFIDGEEVEFEVTINESRGDKKSAAKVTAPGGKLLLASRVPRRDGGRHDNYSS